MKDFSPRVFRKGIDRSRPSSDEKPRSTTTDNSFRCCSCSLQGIHAVVRRRTLREESCSVQNARAVASCGLQDAVLVERDVPCPTGMVCVRSGLKEFYRTSPCQWRFPPAISRCSCAANHMNKLECDSVGSSTTTSTKRSLGSRTRWSSITNSIHRQPSKGALHPLCLLISQRHKQLQNKGAPLFADRPSDRPVDYWDVSTIRHHRNMVPASPATMWISFEPLPNRSADYRKANTASYRTWSALCSGALPRKEYLRQHVPRIQVIHGSVYNGRGLIATESSLP